MKKKSKHNELIKELLEFTIIIVLLVGFVYFSGFILGNVTASDISQTNFSGTYDDTVYNTDHIEIAEAKTAGNYTSRIFDATSEATWLNISWTSTNANTYELYAVDNQADVWKSTDSGETWNLVKDDYNNGATNAANEMTSDNTYLYIAHSQDIWRSGDSGVSWTKVSDDFNGGSSSSLAQFLAYDGSAIYVVDGAEDVYKSTNLGVDWTQTVDDFNEGNGNAKGFVADSNGVLWMTDAQSDVWNSEDSGVTWNLVKDDYNGGDGNDANDLIIDSSDYLYSIEGDDDVWKSEDAGLTWALAKDDYNGEANHVKTSHFQNNTLYILEGDEDLWISTDEAVTWTKQVIDFNGANGDAAGMAGLSDSTAIAFQAKACNMTDCSDASFVSVNSGNINFTGQYFQYKSLFTSDSVDATSNFYNITIGYDVITTTSTQDVNVTSIELNENTYCASNNIYVSTDISESENVTAVAAIFSNGTNGNADDYEIALGITDEDETNLTWSNEWKIPNNVNSGTWNITVKVYNNSAILGQNNISFTVASDGPGYVQVYAPATANVNENIEATIEIINNNTSCNLNYTVEYWIADLDNSINYDSVTETIELSADSGTNITRNREVPDTAKSYVFIASITWPSDSDYTYDTFTAISTATTTVTTTTTTGGSGGSSGGSAATTTTTETTETTIDNTETTTEPETTYTSIDFDELEDETKGALSSGIAGQVIGLENMDSVQLGLTFLLLLGIAIFAFRKKIPFIKNYFKK